MAENDKKAPRVINKSGTLKMDDQTAERKVTRDISGRRMERRNRRDRVRGEVAKKEFDEVTIAVDRVSRTVAGGRRMRFKALVAIGNHKNKVGIGVAKGNDVTTAVAKATSKAKKAMITFNMDGETICHEVRTKVTGADVLMKPAAPGTGIIAGGTVRSIMGLTGVKNLISKSLGSTNKVNIAYAVIEGLSQQTPRNEWVGGEDRKHSVKKAEAKVEKKESKAEEKESKTVEKKSVTKTKTTKATKAESTKKTESAKVKAETKSDKVETTKDAKPKKAAGVKKDTAKTAKKSTSKKEDK